MMITITGAPATGKSSIATYISKCTGINVESLDVYNVRLFEEVGFKSNNEKKLLSKQAEDDFLLSVTKQIKSKYDLILDTSKITTYETIKKLAIDFEFDTYLVICYCDPIILAERYNTRCICENERHISLSVVNQYPVQDGVTEYHSPISASYADKFQQTFLSGSFTEEALKINTTYIEYNFKKLCNDVIAFCDLGGRTFEYRRNRCGACWFDD